MAENKNTQATEEQPKSTFPTEIVDLPSKGFFYPKDNPLSSGQVEIKYIKFPTTYFRIDSREFFI